MVRKGLVLGLGKVRHVQI